MPHRDLSTLGPGLDDALILSPHCHIPRSLLAENIGRSRMCPDPSMNANSSNMESG